MYRTKRSRRFIGVSADWTYDRYTEILLCQRYTTYVACLGFIFSVYRYASALARMCDSLHISAMYCINLDECHFSCVYRPYVKLMYYARCSHAAQSKRYSTNDDEVVYAWLSRTKIEFLVSATSTQERMLLTSMFISRKSCNTHERETAQNYSFVHQVLM